MKTLRLASALGVLLIAAGCSASTAATTTTTVGRDPIVRCGSGLPSTLIGRLALEDGSVIQAFVASGQEPGVLWALSTDPGGETEAVAFTVDGERLAAVSLPAAFDSVTDIALGPGPDLERQYLFLTDRREVLSPGSPLVVARFREPNLRDPDDVVTLDVFEFVLPRRAGVPEAMFVDQELGDIYFVTNSTRSSDLLRAEVPLTVDEPGLLLIEASLPRSGVGNLVSVAQGGQGVGFQSPTEIALWRRSPSATVAETLVQSPCVGALPAAISDALVGLLPDALVAVDRYTFAVYELPIPINLGEEQGTAVSGQGNLAPRLEITQPPSLGTWQAGEAIEVEALVADDQPVAASAIQWELLVYRCTGDEPCEGEVIADATGQKASIPAVFVGTQVPSRVELRAAYADDGGLLRVASIDLRPVTSLLSVESTPSGARVAVGDVTNETPFTVRAVAGDRLLVAVDPVQSIDGRSFEFTEWSDAGERAHEVTIDVDEQTVSVLLRPEPGFVRLSGIAGSFGYTRVPDFANNSVLDMRAWVAMESWNPETDQALLGAAGKALVLEVTPTGNLRGSVVLESGQLVEAISTARVQSVNGERLWVRSVLDLSNGQAMFYTSAEPVSDALAVGWTQLGDAVALGYSGEAIDPPRVFVIGHANRESDRPLAGKVFGAAWLGDGRLLTRVDFSTTRQLTSRAPDFSTWGSWSLVGGGWEYVAAAN